MENYSINFYGRHEQPPDEYPGVHTINLMINWQNEHKIIIKKND